MEIVVAENTTKRKIVVVQKIIEELDKIEITITRMSWSN